MSPAQIADRGQPNCEHGPTLVPFFGGPVARCAVAAVAIVLAVAAGPPEARAITDTVFKYAQPQTGYLLLGPADFFPESSGTAYSTNAGSSITTVSSTGVCFLAGVHLPQSANLTQLTVFYSRRTEADLLYASLHRFNTTDTLPHIIANYPPGEGPTTPRGSVTYEVDPARSAVNNRQHHYAVRVCLAKNAKFFSARVEYTYATAGD